MQRGGAGGSGVQQQGGAGGSGVQQQGGAGGSGVHALHEHLVLHHALHAHVQAPSAAEEEQEEEYDEDDGGEIEDEEEEEEEGVTTEFFPPEASHATIFLFLHVCVLTVFLHVDFGGFSACLLFSERYTRMRFSASVFKTWYFSNFFGYTSFLPVPVDSVYEYTESLHLYCVNAE